VSTARGGADRGATARGGTDRGATARGGEGKRARRDLILGADRKRGQRAGKKARQAPPDSIGGVQIARTPPMCSYLRRTEDMYASDTDRWTGHLTGCVAHLSALVAYSNSVRLGYFSTRGVQDVCTPPMLTVGSHHH
jgi:hypothetical protein